MKVGVSLVGLTLTYFHALPCLILIGLWEESFVVGGGGFVVRRWLDIQLEAEAGAFAF